jgi:hypothetical protein
MALLSPKTPDPPLWRVLLLTGAAGGMGWGIRGQYGHQTGAMLAGVLIALAIVLLFLREYPSLHAARVVALAALGISFGGSMSFAQSIGLTQDAGVVGNPAALAWWMTGLFVKGSIWIGLGGAFLGIGLSRLRYRAFELALLVLAMLGLMLLGIFLLNSPFEPAHRRLPPIYFSASWHWQPNKADLKPRFENWGGLLFALLGLLGYLSLVRKDVLARNVTLAAILTGGLGWVAAQSIQAYHNWHPGVFRRGWLGAIEPVMNWWNVMEIAYGTLIGAGLGLAVWINRRRLGPREGAERSPLPAPAEWALLLLYPALLVAWEFGDFPALEAFADLAFTMGMLPVVAIFGGRRFPYAMCLPLVALPAAGKTLRQLCYKTQVLPVAPGWVLLVVLPLSMMVAAASWSERRDRQGEAGAAFAARALLFVSWTLFCLNFAFFEFPWPWAPPTYRTPSYLIHGVQLAVLTWASLQTRAMEAMPVPRKRI